MDLKIKKHGAERATIWSRPYEDTVYIDPRPNWTDPFRMKAFHGKSDPKYIDLDRFMYLALGWESMLKLVWDSEGILPCMMLDTSCHKRKDFYDLFLDIHHD